MLLPPVDREGMRRKASSAAVECELRLRCGRCRKLCIVDRWRAKVRRALVGVQQRFVRRRAADAAELQELVAFDGCKQ